MKPHEIHNEVVPAALKLLVKSSGGDFGRFMVMLESFNTGALGVIMNICPTNPEGAATAFELMCTEALKRFGMANES